MTTTAPACTNMSDPTWCIEDALIADVPTYDPDASVVSALVKVLTSEAFTNRYTYPETPVIGLRADKDDDNAYLSQYEDHDGLTRGALGGLTVPSDNHAEIHLNLASAPILAVHEAAHATLYSAVKLDHRDGHGQPWREAFRALLEATYPGSADAFDRAVTGTEPCPHGSVDDPDKHKVYA